VWEAVEIKAEKIGVVKAKEVRRKR